MLTKCDPGTGESIRARLAGGMDTMRLTTLMFHYVRPAASLATCPLKVRTVEEFEGQLDYLARHYQVVAPDLVMAVARGEAALPARACLLTFDDGLREHLEIVTPRLLDRGWAAFFFVTALPALERQALDVHRLHFILAAQPDPARLMVEVLAAVARRRSEHGLPSDDVLLARFGGVNRFDGPEVSFVKRLLQRGLPVEARRPIVADLFERLVTADEAAFVEELYLDLDDLRRMTEAGMAIGGHGATHRWMDTLTPQEVALEVQASATLLAAAGLPPGAPWAMSYPYGESVPGVIPLLEHAGCALGFTTRTEETERDWPYRVPRLDTNDLPHPVREPAA